MRFSYLELGFGALPDFYYMGTGRRVGASFLGSKGVHA
jgi:hypothetical protein